MTTPAAKASSNISKKKRPTAAFTIHTLYNTRRTHGHAGYLTPDDVYANLKLGHMAHLKLGHSG